jgi:ParB family chromosome partitioning protein
MSTKRGLGRGLGALIPESMEETIVQQAIETKRIDEIDIDRIVPNQDQPRKHFDKERLDVLSKSIEEHGVLQPIILRSFKTGYEIVAGERRWRASKQAKLKMIPAIILNIEEEKYVEIALIENLQREDLNAIEEAMAYRSLMDKHNYTQEKVAEVVGKSRSYIANTLRLISLDDRVQQDIIAGKLTSGHGKCLAGLPKFDDQYHTAMLCKEKQMTVRELEDYLKKRTVKRKAKTSKDKDLYIKEVEQKFCEVFGTRVEILNGKRKGKIQIEYYTDSDLMRLLDLIEKM